MDETKIELTKYAMIFFIIAILLGSIMIGGIRYLWRELKEDKYWACENGGIVMRNYIFLPGLPKNTTEAEDGLYSFCANVYLPYNHPWRKRYQ